MPEMNIAGEPDGGNLHVRFDEGRQLRLAATLRGFARSWKQGAGPTAIVRTDHTTEDPSQRNARAEGAGRNPAEYAMSAGFSPWVTGVSNPREA